MHVFHLTRSLSDVIFFQFRVAHLSVAVAMKVQRWTRLRQWDTISIPLCAVVAEWTRWGKYFYWNQIIRCPITSCYTFSPIINFPIFPIIFHAISSSFSLISRSIYNSDLYIFIWCFSFFRINLTYWNWFVFLCNHDFFSA